MLKMFDVGGTVQPPTSTSDTSMDGYETILSMLKDLKTSNQTSSDVKTTLNEKQATRLMDSIFDFYERYFTDIPMGSTISKNFVWNIPTNVYKMTIDSLDKEYPDVLNPMLLFYPFLTIDNEFEYAKYLQILYRILTSWKETIDDLAKEYDEYSEEES
jgi:hypothetical protein